MPASTWWLKIQHDTLQQMLVNCTILGAPILISASNPTPQFHPVEIAGWLVWLCSWLWEVR